MRGVARFFEHLFSILRVFFLWIVALFLPRLCIWYSHQVESVKKQHTVTTFKLGLENIPDSLLASCGYDTAAGVGIGLITNQTGKDQAGTNNVDILLRKGFDVRKVFVPAASASLVHTQFSEAKKVPVVVLQQKNSRSIIAKKNLEAIDVLMFDIQDAGMRYFGHSTTLLQIMRAAARFDKPVIVLDRPNLLGGGMESSLAMVSATDSLSAIPVRHGMTIGELARYFNAHVLEKKAKLHVVAMQQYSRMAEKRRQFIAQLSPRMVAADFYQGYSFLGLLGEVTPFDVAAGTKKVHQCILLPESITFSKQKWYELHTLLKGHGIESKFHRYFNNNKKQYCRGLHLVVGDINTFSSLDALLAVLKFFKDAGVKLSYSHQFDKALGTSNVCALLDGSLSRDQLAQRVNSTMQAFFYKAFNCFLYKPLPTILQARHI